MKKLVIDHLDETRNNLMKELAYVSDDEFNSKPDLNSWSIAQVCHHLVLVEAATIKAVAWGIKEDEKTPREPRKIDLIFDRTRKIQAPKIVEPNIEPFTVQQIIDLLNSSREKLVAFLSGIEDESILTKTAVKHPAFGELPLNQWIELIYLHEQRHIEQIKEIKTRLAANTEL
ncbi:DinB family protein [Sporosarcina cyprini]|uniref:DinB family protein n=1 Tax=Sporosarcina cyprini TaxID=2910523 RepID=UPI001EDF1F62|nr:DinB family protein [Sporosarcina cyprini]MCG3087448.1 DinB family protein [Sporosarcina cyprini]